ncbi:MAG: hypothetical protein ABIQ86_01665 [Steroidobacteraceae bacterium]
MTGKAVRGKLVVGAICLAEALTASAAGMQVPAPTEQLDEVVVEGARLSKMRERIVAAEDRFYALYNELNKNDDYDVHCTNEAPLGTRLTKRFCRVEFYSRAQQEYAASFVATLTGAAGGGSAKSPTLVALEREADYRASMVKVVQENPALLRLLKERDALERRYNEARKQRFK